MVVSYYGLSFNDLELIALNHLEISDLYKKSSDNFNQKYSNKTEYYHKNIAINEKNKALELLDYIDFIEKNYN